MRPVNTLYISNDYSKQDKQVDNQVQACQLKLESESARQLRWGHHTTAFLQDRVESWFKLRKSDQAEHAGNATEQARNNIGSASHKTNDYSTYY